MDGRAGGGGGGGLGSVCCGMRLFPLAGQAVTRPPALPGHSTALPGLTAKCPLPAK